jgi:hypothetical protein
MTARNVFGRMTGTFKQENGDQTQVGFPDRSYIPVSNRGRLLDCNLDRFVGHGRDNHCGGLGNCTCLSAECP